MNEIPAATQPGRHDLDYYDILGLPSNAAASDIDRAYWRLARIYRALPEEEAHASVIGALNEAAEILGTPALRRAYDAARLEADEIDAEPEGAPAAVPPAPEVFARRRRLAMVGLGLVMIGLVSCTGTTSARALNAALVPGASLTAAPVIFLGDSVTDGAGASSVDSTYAHLLKERLDASGYTKPGDVASVISALGGQVVDLRKAQDVGRTPRSLIVVEVGAHSVMEDRETSSAEFGLRYGMMLDCLQSTGAAVVVSTVPWLSWPQTDPSYMKADDRSRIIRWQAAMRGIPVADLWSATKDRRDLLSPDAFHPSDAGHALIADLFWQKIQPLLASPRGAFRARCNDDWLLAARAM